jgi:rubredoxin
MASWGKDQEPEAGREVCGRCGATVEPRHAAYCGACGAVFSPSNPPARSSRQRPAKSQR